MTGPSTLPNDTQLRQHFQNYFELLLSTERAKLHHAISVGGKENSERLMNEVEQRISYLKGATRMGLLLCLISSEEAKNKYERLMAERESLRSTCAGQAAVEPDQSHPGEFKAKERLMQLREMIAATGPGIMLDSQPEKLNSERVA